MSNIVFEQKSDPAQGGSGSHPDALVIISIFNKVSWGPSYVSRVCQHAYSSSQSLQDIYESLPCIFSAALNCPNPAGMKGGCAMCIENTLYSDSRDYAK